VVCRIIEVQHTIVPTGTKLELRALEKVIINPGFRVESGATFVIE